MHGKAFRGAVASVLLAVAVFAASAGMQLPGSVALGAAPVMQLDSRPGPNGVTPTQQDDPVAALRRLGAQIEVDVQRPDKPVVKLSFARPATSAAMSCLEVLPELRELAVYGFAVRDADLAHVNELAHLQTLRLNYTQVTDDGLAALAGLSELKSLNLDGSFRITDAGLRHLKGLRTLEDLSLTFTQTSDRGIAELQQSLPKLTVHRRYAPSDLLRDKEAEPDKPAAARGPLGVMEDDLRRSEADARKRRQDWPGFALVLEEMIQAHPSEVFLRRVYAWNLAYNLSAEWDEVGDRYYWVRQGIAALLHAARENPEEGKFPWDIGWFVAHKIGSSDEHATYRLLFAEDSALHEPLIAGLRREDILGSSGKPDNWLVARQWFMKAERPLLQAFNPDDEQSMSPLIFYADAPMCQINYAEAIEEEGASDEAVIRAWNEAERQWNALGDRRIPITKDTAVRLNDLPNADPEQAKRIRTEREILNYDYWMSRCRFEQLPTMIEGRRLLREAIAEYEKARIAGGKVGSREIAGRFERAFQSFRQTLDADSALLADEEVCRELVESIALYRDRVLRAERLPDDFSLKPVVDRWEAKPGGP